MDGPWRCVHGIETDKYCRMCEGVLVKWDKVKEFLCHTDLDCAINGCICGLDNLTQELDVFPVERYPG